MTFVDLHSHYLPGIDDGVRTLEDGIALCQGLRGIGFGTVMATPHIRTAMFENRKAGVEHAHARFCEAAAGAANMPALGLGAEHFFDDVFWTLFQRGEAVPYPGGKAALVELPRERIPMRLEHCFFEMRVRGVRPILAHPERYRPLFRKSTELEPLRRAGAIPLLDLMSLAGKYGRRPRKAAERLLAEGAYYAACSDAHKPSDVPIVAEGIALLRKRIGDGPAEAFLSTHPQRILDGTADYE
ncbi:MAG: CpsB/CapC family capsule biosynthesis tyrosine phosphatase [Myxococcota bacterium]